MYAMSAQRFLSDAPKERYHIVYIDPPFDFTDREVEELVGKLHSGEFLKSDALIAVERTAKGSTFSWPDGFVAARERKYGAATIYYGSCAP